MPFHIIVSSEGSDKANAQDATRQVQQLSQELEQERARNRELNRRIEQLTRLVEETIERVAELNRELEKAREKLQAYEAAACRSAAPFRRPENHLKTDPKRPGRKPGHPASWRPEPVRIHQEIVVPLENCPKCGRPILKAEPLEQIIEEHEILVRVTRLTTFFAHCYGCGEDVQSTHPLQVSVAGGCAKVQLGARALALAADLKYRLGLSFGKTAQVLQQLGLRITRGGIYQAMARMASRIEPLYQSIAKAIARSPCTHADETSWWVGAPGWWLWVFTNPGFTFYRVDNSRGASVVQGTLGVKYPGILVSDCLATYDPIDCRKQKCYAHHLKALGQAITDLPPEEAGPLSQLRLLLKTAMILGKSRAECPSEQFLRYRSGIQQAIERILDQVYPCPQVEKALHRFRTHRQHLFTFLDHPEVDPTNNLAERQLRPAVIARKVSCGNRTLSGKYTWEILASTAATCTQQARSFLDLIRLAAPLTATLPDLVPP